MTNTIFHITVATLVGAMAVFGAAIAMSPSTPVPTDPSQPEISTTLKDACVVNALSRLPKIDGMRVTHSSYKFYRAEGQWIEGIVSVSIKAQGHQANYNWICSVSTNTGRILLTAS